MYSTEKCVSPDNGELRDCWLFGEGMRALECYLEFGESSGCGKWVASPR